jgi:1-acyl-sn-glycerol-3-phosphate acyltransferase
MRALARALVRLFYHRVDVVGVERVPPSGPLVIVANHRNALVDPLILIATLPRVLRPVAKAPLFRHPLLAPFLRLAGALPVHRRRDPGSDPTQNAAMFRAVAAALRQGGAILIFPEGVSQPEPVLMPLRTGVARMVLGTEGDPGTPATTLLPVGLTFHEPGTFRTGWALVLAARRCRSTTAALAARDPERAVRDLTARVAEALRALIVEIEDRETLRLTEGLEAVRRAEAEDAPGPIGRGTSRAERVAWVQVATRAYRWLAPRAPARVARFRAEVERYLADLERLGLSPHVVGRAYPPAWLAATRSGRGWRSPAAAARSVGSGQSRAAVLADAARRRRLCDVGRRHRHRQAGRRGRPLPGLLDARGLGRVADPGRVGAGGIPRGLILRTVALGWQAHRAIRRDARAVRFLWTAISSRGWPAALAGREMRCWRGSCPRRCWRAAPAPGRRTARRQSVARAPSSPSSWRPRGRQRPESFSSSSRGFMSNG